MSERLCSVSGWHLQRRNGDDVLAWHLERLSARRDHGQPGRGTKDLGHERSHCSEKMFTVVEQEQQLPVLQVGEQDLQRLCCGLISEVEGLEHRIGHEVTIANLGELDQPGAVRESPSEIGPNPKSESGLPDTPRTHQTDEAGGRELLSDLGELPPAADEARRLCGQIAQPTSRPGHVYASTH